MNRKEFITRFVEQAGIVEMLENASTQQQSTSENKMSSKIPFNPSCMGAKYQLSQQYDRKAWILGMNETLVHDDNEYHLDLHITVQGGRDAQYIMTPRLSEMGTPYPIVTMKEFIIWLEEMKAHTPKLEDQLQAEIEYEQTHWIMEHKSCPLDSTVLLNWYIKACEMANHFQALINLGIISLHVT